jgi:hypothetical protein
LDSFKAFSQLFEVKINFLETHPNEIDIRRLIPEQHRFRKIVEAKRMDNSQKESWIDSYKAAVNRGVYFY